MFGGQEEVQGHQPPSSTHLWGGHCESPVQGVLSRTPAPLLLASPQAGAPATLLQALGVSCALCVPSQHPEHPHVGREKLFCRFVLFCVFPQSPSCKYREASYTLSILLRSLFLVVVLDGRKHPTEISLGGKQLPLATGGSKRSAVSLPCDFIFLEENITCALLGDCWYLHTLRQLNTTPRCFPKPS